MRVHPQAVEKSFNCITHIFYSSYNPHIPSNVLYFLSKSMWKQHVKQNIVVLNPSTGRLSIHPLPTCSFHVSRSWCPSPARHPGHGQGHMETNHSHAHSQPKNLTCVFWSLEGSRSSWRNPTHVRGKLANLTQKKATRRRQTCDLLAVVQRF